MRNQHLAQAIEEAEARGFEVQIVILRFPDSDDTEVLAAPFLTSHLANIFAKLAIWYEQQEHSGHEQEIDDE